MSEQFEYPATVKKDKEGFFLVTFPDFPEAATDGASLEEALYEAQDALEEAIAGRINRKERIPTPSSKKARQHLIPVPAQMAVKAALTIAMQETHTSNVKLAKLLGCDEKEVRRLLDPHHPSKLPRMQEALEMLGKQLIVSMASAA